MGQHTTFEKLEGIHTIESIMELLKIQKKLAIQKIYLLRKKGYVKTKYTSDKKRIYYISKENLLGGTTYHEIINKHSPLKLSESKTHKIYGKKPTLEETLIYAIKTKNIRTIISALGLFKSINNWTLLGRLARENNVEQEVGALYDVARTLFRTRSMSKQLINSILPKEDTEMSYLIKGYKSKDFIEIQNKWKTFVPLNKADLEEYKLK